MLPAVGDDGVRTSVLPGGGLPRYRTPAPSPRLRSPAPAMGHAGSPGGARRVVLLLVIAAVVALAIIGGVLVVDGGYLTR